MRHHTADDVQDAENIDIKIPSGFSVGKFFQSSHLPVTGVIDDDIDFAESGERLLDSFRDASLVQYIHFERQKVFRFFADRSNQRLGASRSSGDLKTFAQKLFRQ